MIRINNIVLLYTLSKKINFDIVLEKFPNISYHRKRFSGAILKFSKATLLIFNSEKLIVTGITSLPNAQKTIKSFIEKVAEKDLSITSKKVLNMTCSGKLPFKFNIIQFISENKNASWEPEIFPAMYLQLDNHIKVIYFPSSQKFIITGAKKHIDLRNAYTVFSKRTIKHKT